MLVSTKGKKKLIADYASIGRGRALLIFNHGLGDFINFLPIYRELKSRFLEWKFDIGTNRQFKDIYPIVSLDNWTDMRAFFRQYTYLFQISYPEPPATEKLSKPYYCNKMEIGLDNFKWTPFESLSVVKKVKNPNLIGCHFFGNTNQKNKSIDVKLVEKIWNDLMKLGYFPYEIHNEKFNDNTSRVPFFNSDNSLRFQHPSLRKIAEVITKCQYFIGIDSGPLYLAGNLLGYDKCIGMEKNYKFSKYLPFKLDKIDMNNYKFSDLKTILENKDENSD